MDQGSGGHGVQQSSPSATSSQGEMADNEMDASVSQPTERASPPPPPKKKRTRTLTTPHQSAVLHALLAQSRFPTTAMREEVGRSIGLSARKVQIWFQNQRQKARRPRGQNAPPLTRPPQFGPFQNMPASSSFTSTGLAAQTAGPSSHNRRPSGSSVDTALLSGSIDGPNSARSESFSHRENFAPGLRPIGGPSTPQLSGPGVPGTRVGLIGEHQAVETPRAAGSTPPTASPLGFFPSYTYPAPHLFESHESMEREMRVHSAGPLPQVRSRRIVDRGEDLRITLPPLDLDRLQERGVRSAPGWSAGFQPMSQINSLLNTAPALPPLRDLHHMPPVHHAGYLFPRGQSAALPPPSTLQPQPQWDDPTFSPYNQHRHSSHSFSSRPGSPVRSPPRYSPSRSEHQSPAPLTGFRPQPFIYSPHASTTREERSEWQLPPLARNPSRSIPEMPPRPASPLRHASLSRRASPPRPAQRSNADDPSHEHNYIR